MMTDIVEIMARGMAIEDAKKWGLVQPWWPGEAEPKDDYFTLTDLQAQKYRWRAQAALQALEGAGYVVVPAEPTEGMERAYGREVAEARLKDVLCPKIAYKAMIAEARKQ